MPPAVAVTTREILGDILTVMFSSLVIALSAGSPPLICVNGGFPRRKIL